MMEEKELFKLEIEYTWEEYKKELSHPLVEFIRYYMKLFPLVIIFTIILALVLGTDFCDIYKYCVATAVTLLVFCLFTFVYFFIVFRYNLIINTNRYIQNVTFFSNYLKLEYDKISLKLEYNNIKKIIETDTNIYIVFKKKTIPLLKEKLNSKDLKFIKKINKNLYVVKPNNKKYEIYEKIKYKVIENNNVKDRKPIDKKKVRLFINYLLLILSIISFLYPFIFYFLNYNVTSIPKLFLSLQIKDCFVYCLFLPIISLIYGLKYKKENKIAILNLILGIWFTIILIFCADKLNPQVESLEYDDFKIYKNVLNMYFPANGKYIRSKKILEGFDYSILEYVSGDYFSLTVDEACFYNEEDKRNVEKNINKENRWLKYNEAKNEFSNLLRDDMKEFICKDCYLLVYNEVSQKFNNSNLDKKTDKILVAFYNKEQSHLIIERYTFKEYNPEISVYDSNIRDAVSGLDNE